MQLHHAGPAAPLPTHLQQPAVHAGQRQGLRGRALCGHALEHRDDRVPHKALAALLQLLAKLPLPRNGLVPPARQTALRRVCWALLCGSDRRPTAFSLHLCLLACLALPTSASTAGRRPAAALRSSTACHHRRAAPPPLPGRRPGPAAPCSAAPATPARPAAVCAAHRRWS